MVRWFYRLNTLAVVLCFALVVFGAFVRLSNAGLGCPDWPGCYGHIAVPQTAGAVSSADQAYPNRPVQAPKAWKEMIHRYLAGIVGLLILGMAVIAGRCREVPRRLIAAVAVLLLVQIVFGALTVTWKVMPIIVTTHLLLGMALLSLLFWMWLRQRLPAPSAAGRPRHAAGWAVFALVVLSGQIFLGGWTSTNYAALGCPDFPTCEGRWWPPTDYASAFKPWRGLGTDYQGGVLDAEARATIHFTHRLGALTTTLVLGGLALYLLLRGRRLWRGFGGLLLAALVLQVSIGISIVIFGFPLWLADAHNGGAALLLLTMVLLNHSLWSARETRA